ncbi:MAG: N-terminal acetyltransferase [Cyphobasidiales sp. Tagirdzhanova-0007]|nr:MAG: N-terminal acetyltransferase [Cyphobasidiales sp. Tagirdzhanova-0007]
MGHGLNHMILFVSFQEDPDIPDEEHLYIVDVGFGGANITAPLPMHPGSTAKGALDETHRLTYRSHPRSSLELQEGSEEEKVLPPMGTEYVLSYSVPERLSWRAMYSFNCAEGFAEDYASLHYATCLQKDLFTKNILLARYIEKSQEEPLGRATLFNNSFKRRILNEEEKYIKMTDEKHRIEVLREEFGLLDLPDDAEEIIKQKAMSL